MKQSTAITIPIFAHDASGDAVTGILDASFTKRISKAGGAFAAMTVTITEMEAGFYSLPLSTAHTDTLGILTLRFTAAGAKQVNLQFRIHARIPDDLAYPTVSGRSLNVGTTGVADANLVQVDGVANVAATLNLKQINVVNSTGSAMILTSTGGDGHGAIVTGNGTGDGLMLIAGATGHGLDARGGTTTGHGANFVATTSGMGANLLAVGTGNHGLLITGATDGSGLRAVANGTAPGIVGIGAGALGHGILGTAGATGTSGIRGAGSGTGPGISGVGGSTAGAAGASFTGGAGGAAGLLVTGTLGSPGLSTVGGATGPGILVTGGATSGNGISITTTSGDGVSILPTAGHGIIVTANGTSKHGIVSTGGTAGTSDGVRCVAGTGGVDLRANITGNLAGTVTTVTTVTNSVTLGSTGIDNITIETGLNARQSLAIIASACAGVLSGAATTNVLIQAAGVPATNRINATVDSSGNRSAVTLSLPA